MLTFLPPDIAVSQALFLVASAGFTSLMTAVLGIGGGMLLLAIMAQIVPVTALIPAHGIVQLGSNANRAFMTRKHVDWSLVKVFLLGSLLGAAFASMIVVQLPVSLIELSVAIFILWMVWGPKPKKVIPSTTKIALTGLGTTLLTMFVGATGPLVAATIHRSGYDKLRTVATFSSCMSVQNLLKIAVFSFIGFAFTQWLPLLAAMVASGAAGTWIGLNVLKKIPGDRFKHIFRITITLLSIRLLWQSLVSEQILCQWKWLCF